MSDTITLVTPLPPNRANARGHWAKRLKDDHAWEQRAEVFLYAQRGQKPPEPLLRYAAQLHVVTTRPQDLDNAATRAKPLLDYLKRRGWIVDDGPAHMVSLEVRNSVDAKEPRLELTLRRVA